MLARWSRHGRGLLMGAALALGLLVATNLWLADTASGSLSRGSGSRLDVAPYAYYVHVDAQPGDLIWLNSGFLAGRPVELWVVEGGEFSYLLRNETPPHVYAHVPPPEPSPTGYGLTRVSVVRPPVPEDLPEMEAVAPTGWRGEGLDFVWVLRADAETSERELNATLALMERGPHEFANAEFKVTRGWMLDVQPILTALEVMALLGMAAGALLWTIAPRRPLPGSDEGGVAAGVALAERAFLWLRALRGLLAATGVGLLLFGFFLVAGMERLVERVYFTSPELRWSLHMQWATALVWGTLALVWLLTFVGVQREVARWRRLMREAPGLG